MGRYETNIKGKKSVMPKVVLAYSGGLDASVILKWLAERGHEVVAYIADVDQNEDLEAVKQKALATGAVKAVVVDLKEELVTDYVYAAVKANAVYEGRYLLGTSLARPVIAKAHGIDVKASTEKPFSEDANLIHISHDPASSKIPRSARPRTSTAGPAGPRRRPTRRRSSTSISRTACRSRWST
jgi:argininosuccinate synthase